MFGLSRPRNAGIATKLCGALALLAVAAGIVGGAGLYAIHVYDEKASRMERASERAFIGEKVNGLLNSVVMDSRGLYLTNDPVQIEQFSKPLLANLALIDDLMGQWSRLLGPSLNGVLADCERQVREFIALRTDLVRAARTSGAAEAGRIGNNTANRTNRQALNATVTALAHQNEDDVGAVARDLTQFQRTMSIVLPAVTLGVILSTVMLVLFLVIGGITRPLARIIEAMKKLAAGEFDVVVPGRGKRDEIGQMAEALEVFRRQATENRRLTEAGEREQREAEEQKRAALMAMATNIETAAGVALAAVGQRTEELAAIAGSMRSMTERTGNSAKAAAAAAGQALATAQTVASAAEELAASIRSIGSQVSRSTAMVVCAVAAGDATRAAIDDLGEEVSRIGAVADMIGDVARRTNLLALNATIEAARAGEAGKGFAVVASEVKQLAAQTARSTQEIADHIGAVRSAAGAALGAVNRMKETVSAIDAVSASIAEAVEQQDAATAEIARNVSDTAAAVSEMNERNVEVSVEAERGGEYAETVLANTRGLGSAVTDLKAAIIRTVRTSSQEVDRRLFSRHPVDLAAQASIGGRPSCAVRLLDISEQEARFTGCPERSIGQRGELRLDGLATPLRFTVATRHEDETGVRLDGDPAAANAVRTLLENRSKRAA
jgi:methyl-accepting chemotaxis protein